MPGTMKSRSERKRDGESFAFLNYHHPREGWRRLLRLEKDSHGQRMPWIEAGKFTAQHGRQTTAL